MSRGLSVNQLPYRHGRRWFFYATSRKRWRRRAARRLVENKAMSTQKQKKTRRGWESDAPGAYMRAGEAIRYLRIGRRTLSRWQAEGRVGFVRAGRKLVLFKKADLDRLMDRLTVRAVV